MEDVDCNGNASQVTAPGRSGDETMTEAVSIRALFGRVVEYF